MPDIVASPAVFPVVSSVALKAETPLHTSAANLSAVQQSAAGIISASSAVVDVVSDAGPKVTPQASATPLPEKLSLHIQGTNTQQYHGTFPAAYSGPQSLSAQPDTAKTTDVTAFIGMRLWRGGELYINPEIDQGFGLGSPSVPGQTYNGTFGAAGFSSGEAYKVGSASMYERVQRVFIRQIYNLGGKPITLAPDINQLGENVASKRLTLTIGKFAVTDVFDANAYAHDPKNDFLNWSIIDGGAFDYAADAWGYTSGASAELLHEQSAIRVGLFQLSKAPNVIAVESIPLRQYSPMVEIERDTSLFGGHSGAVKVLAYGDDGYMGSYADAISAAGAGIAPNTSMVRADKHWKLGGDVNVAQEIAPHIGVFSRYSAMNGTYEAFEFADIDRSFSAGISIDGGLYHRANDVFGLALADNAISAPAQQYFAAGGLGILIGDGNLSYRGERIMETYYKVGLAKAAGVTADFQRIADPGYNSARGPVSIFGLRYHVQI